MKHTIIQTSGIIALSVLLFASCSGETPVDGDAGQELVVSADIIPSGIDSKAPVGTLTNGTDKQSFAEDDKIKITQSDNGDSKDAYYLLKSTKWLPETDGLTTDGNTHTYTAIYPFDFINIVENQDAVESGSADNFAKSDKLEAVVSGTTSNYIPFKFKHAFTKITISVAYKDDSKRKDVTAQLAGNGIRTNGADSETIKMLRTSLNAEAAMNHTFICILYPGETRGFVLTVNGKTSMDVDAAAEIYTQKPSNFETGRNYIYNFSSNDNLILNSVTVKEFNEDGSTDMGSAT